MKESIKNLLEVCIMNDVSIKDMSRILENLDDIHRCREYMDEHPEYSRYYRNQYDMEQEAIEDTITRLNKYGIKIIIDSMI